MLKNTSRSPAFKLLAWYRKNGRALPWRNTRDPYKILVSEIMLQQTQVLRVILFYEKWLKRFPDWKALARATNAQVIRAWSGLGYNRRALALRDIARHVVAHGEPKSSQEWLKLKGIGVYTSAALGIFAHGERILPIDTNIRRVLDRLLLGLPYPDPARDDALRRRAETFLLKRGAYRDVPQALFDLATSICTKVPSCATCPLRRDCPAAKKFLVGHVKIPRAMIKKNAERRHRNKPYPDRIYRGRILKLVQKSRGGINNSLIGELIDPTFDRSLDTPWLKRMLSRMAKDGLMRTDSSPHQTTEFKTIISRS